MSGLMNSYYAISEQHAAEIAKLKTELSTLRGAAEEMGKALEECASRAHQRVCAMMGRVGTDQILEIAEIRNIARSALARYQKLITKKEN